MIADNAFCVSANVVQPEALYFQPVDASVRASPNVDNTILKSIGQIFSKLFSIGAFETRMSASSFEVKSCNVLGNVLFGLVSVIP